MIIWSSEIKELRKLHESFREQLPVLEKELYQLFRSEDPNVLMLYSRRCLEVIITDLCENELRRSRKTEPLQGIIDKLNKEEMVPSNIIASMHGLNNLSTFGTHPKDFDPAQVKPVLINLGIIIRWYLGYIDDRPYRLKEGNVNMEIRERTIKELRKYSPGKPSQYKNYRLLTISGIVASVITLILYILLKDLPADKANIAKDISTKMSIAVLPFENLTGDSSLNWFQRGISSLIINGLGNSPELAVSDDQTMYDVMESMDQVFTASLLPAMAKEVAKKAGAEIYLSGSIHGMDGIFRILANLYHTLNGEIIWTQRVEGDLRSSEYLYLVDSLCDEVKNFLETRAISQKTDNDFQEVYPNKVEAYRHFIEGMNMILASDYESAINSLTKSVEIDSTFTFASFYLAFAYNFSNLDPGYTKSMIWTEKAFKNKDRLPLKYQNWVALWYACLISENQEDIIRNCRLLEESEIESRLLWLDLGVTYNEALHQYDKAVAAFRKVEEISNKRGSEWKYDRYYNDYCDVLLMAGLPAEVKRISESGLKINPDNRICLIYKGSGYVMSEDTNSVSEIIYEIRAACKKANLPESSEEWAIGKMYVHGKDTLNAARHFRRAYILNPDNPNRIRDLARLLVRSGIGIKEGLKLAQEGLNKFPDNISLLWVKGVALNKLGKHHEALDILEEVDSKYSGYLRLLQNDILEAKKAVSDQSNN